MKIRSRYFVAAALLALVAPSVFMAASGKNDMAATARDISVINAVFKEMNTRYVDSVDVDRAMTTAIDAMLNDLDPYTEFISAEEASDFMAMSTTGEYGGIGLVLKDHIWEPNRNWGYVQFNSSKEVTDEYVKYADMLYQMIKRGFSAAVYTQTTDVEVEVNGLMTYDRKVIKLDEKRVKEINTRICNSLKK